MDLIPDAIEQPWSAPRDDRMYDERVLIDEPVGRERCGELHSAERNASPRLFLESSDGVEVKLELIERRELASGATLQRYRPV